MAKVAKFKILKNQPLPDRTSYPFAEMEVGDCVLFPLVDRKKVSVAASARRRRHGEQYAIRKLDKKTLGVWRVS